jgi:hypothetical protein
MPLLTRTWPVVSGVVRRRGRRAGRAVVVVAALLGAAAGVKVFGAPDRPDLRAVVQSVGNQHAQAGAFAADFVVTWLTATTADRAALRRYVSAPADGPALPVTPAAVVSVPQVVSVIRTGATADTAVYAVTVSLDERPYASAPSRRAFYRVPVLMWRYQPRALTMPARVDGPGPGADVAVGYHRPLPPGSPVSAVVAGFVRTYLTAGTGLDRYVTAGSGLAPVGGYQDAQLVGAGADRDVPDDAPAGFTVHVLAAVRARTAQFVTVAMTYPLALQNSGGTWMVSAIDLSPQLDDTDPDPLKPVG